jgi:sec-independent protein translocase protein TatB
MFDIGALELILIGVVALIVVGPERLPRLARTAGLWLARARRTLSAMKQEIDREVKAQELKEILDRQAKAQPVHTIIDDLAQNHQTAPPPSNQSSQPAGQPPSKTD